MTDRLRPGTRVQPSREARLFGGDWTCLQRGTLQSPLASSSNAAAYPVLWDTALRLGLSAKRLWEVHPKYFIVVPMCRRRES